MFHFTAASPCIFVGTSEAEQDHRRAVSPTVQKIMHGGSYQNSEEDSGEESFKVHNCETDEVSESSSHVLVSRNVSDTNEGSGEAVPAGQATGWRSFCW